MKTLFYSVRSHFYGVKTHNHAVRLSFYGVKSLYYNVRLNYYDVKLHFYGMKTRFYKVKTRFYGAGTCPDGARSRRRTAVEIVVSWNRRRVDAGCGSRVFLTGRGANFRARWRTFVAP